MKNRKGFTLAELLIVVAIIGVLVSISIPMFTKQLEKSRQAVDLSNMRSAQAAAVADYLVSGASGQREYNYDASRGDVTNAVPTGYGKAQTLEYNGVQYTPIGRYVKVLIDGDNVVTSWSDSTAEIVVASSGSSSGG